MAGQDAGAPDPPVVRRLLVVAVVRATATVALLVTGYYLVPLDGHVGTGVGLALGLAVVGAVVVWQVRAILASDAPRLRAVQAVAVALPLFLLLFAATYAVLSGSAPGSFTERLGRTDALYFTVTVFTTVGFGDIAPVSGAARLVTTVQMVLGLVVVGVVVRIVLGAVRVAVRRREEQAGPGDRGPGA